MLVFLDGVILLRRLLNYLKFLNNENALPLKSGKALKLKIKHSATTTTLLITRKRTLSERTLWKDTVFLSQGDTSEER